MPVNTTGKPQTQFYTLGKGALYFAPEGEAGLRHLGNAPSFAVNLETNTVDHTSSLDGLGEIDKSVTISQRVGLSFTLDEITHQNLADFLAGSESSFSNAVAISGFSKYSWIASVELGKWYDIVDSNGVRGFDFQQSSDVALENNAGAVALVENTDYEIDLEMGRIFFLTTASNVADGDTVDLTVTANASAAAVPQVDALAAGEVRGRLVFVQRNEASNATLKEYDFKQVSVRADGDAQAIGEEFMTLAFTGTAEKDTNGDTLVISTPAQS